MPTPKSPESYPDWMLRIANDFECGVRKRVLEFDTPAAALSVRRQIYGLRDALVHSGQRASYPNFQTVRVRVVGNRVEVLHVDEYLPQPKETS